MKFPIRIFLLALALPILSSAQTTEVNQPPSATTLEEVLVTGEQPGPGLWKVSKGDHTLWILGMYGPLPKKMIWHSNQVTELLAQSQQVIGAGRIIVGVDSSAGFFEKLKSGVAFSRFEKNPNEAKLSDVLPPNVYAKWVRLKAKYIGRSISVERLRPLFAARELQQTAIRKAGFSDTNASAVVAALIDVEKKHNLKFSAPGYKINLKLKEPAKLVKYLSKMELHDLECFAQTIDGLEPKLELMRQRANAWATGDIEALIRLNRFPVDQDCMDLLATAIFAADDMTGDAGIPSTMTRLKQEFERGIEDIRRNWVAAVEVALAKNTITFAYSPIDELVSPDGRLALLRQKGYLIQEPTKDSVDAAK